MTREKVFRGDRLKLARETMQLSQEQISELLGIDKRMYIRYEKGQGEPAPFIIKRFSEMLNVSTDYLYGLTDDSRRRDVEEYVLTPKDIALLNAADRGDLAEVGRLLSERNAPKKSKSAGAMKGDPKIESTSS